MPPVAPRNVRVLSPFELGVWDIRWDSPTDYPENASYVVLGVDILRSFDGPDGPYTKLNSSPVTITHYRDDLDYGWYTEDVTNAFTSRGDDSLKRWEFKTSRRMQVASLSGPSFLNNPAAVTVTANGTPCAVKAVDGANRRVTLSADPIFDPVAMKNNPVKLPQAGETVLCTYPVLENNSKPLKSRRIFYKVLTVTTAGTTPESQAPAISPYQMEELDFIWREAVRRNDWILQQGGSRVKVLVRKWAGERCETHESTHVTSPKLCPICYGTGYVGGYDGPYDLLIAPPASEWRIQHMATGFHNAKQFQSWTMVPGNPLLAPRDLVLMQNGERYIVGSVNFAEHRGVQLQQQFDLSLLDPGDAAYNVPVNPSGPSGNGHWDLPGGGTNPSGSTGPGGGSTPPVTDHTGIEDHREERGTSITFGAIEY